MIAFGGAAPLHAARLAEKLGIQEVVIPTGAGVGSAIGFLRAGIAYELVKTQYLDLRNYDPATINAMFDEMKQYAEGIVRQAEPVASLVEKRTAFMRYRGQGHEIAIDLPVRAYSPSDDAHLAELFRQKYLQLFNRTIPGLTQEVISWSLSLGVEVDAPPRIEPGVSGNAARYTDSRATQSIYDARQGRFSRFGVNRRDTLAPGDRILGPAVIIEDETTTVVSASFDACINSVGYIVLTRKR
jgi:N-methylhydantoinase A